MALSIEEKRERMAKARAVAQANRELANTMIEDEPLTDPSEDVTLSEHKWLGEKGKSLYIPSWYKSHKQNFNVTQDKKPLGFKIKDVMPHRRWAIRGDGELLDQRDFEPLYERYISEIAARGVDPKVQHIPRVERFVNAMRDPRDGPGLVAIGFDPDKPAPEEDNGMRYDPLKDVIFSIKEDADRTSRAEKIETLFRMRQTRDITEETFEKEMRALSPDLGVDGPSAA